MAFTWESLYSLFSPPTPRPSSPNGTPSLSFADFSKSNGQAGTKQTDLPMPSNSAFGGEAGPPPPSPTESSISAASERDFLVPNPLSRTSTVTTVSSGTSTTLDRLEQEQQQQQLLPQHYERSNATPAAAQEERPPTPPYKVKDTHPPDIMSREFPKPTHEPSLDEMLARAPCKRSLHYDLKHCRMRPAYYGNAEPLTEAEAAERTREFEETKRKLREARDKLSKPVAKR